MHLTIISPEKIIFIGDVDSVTVPGKMGMFTVLNNHAPIISILTKGEVVYKKNQQETKVQLDTGLIEVKKNKVTVCVETKTNL